MKKAILIILASIIPLTFIILICFAPKRNANLIKCSNYVYVGGYYSKLQNLKNANDNENNIIEIEKDTLKQLLENDKGQFDRYVNLATGLLALLISSIPLIKDAIEKVMKNKNVTINLLEKCKETDENTIKGINHSLKTIGAEREFNNSVLSFNIISNTVLIAFYLYDILQIINIFYIQEHLNYILLQIAKL